LLIGPGASRLAELEEKTRRRFYLVPKEGVHLDHFLVLEEGKRDALAPEGPVEEGASLNVKLVEVGLHDPEAGVAKLDGIDIAVAGAAKLVGKKVKIRVERVLDRTAYATLVRRGEAAGPITAESEAEKPTRRPAAKRAEQVSEAPEAPEAAEAGEAAPDAADEAAETKPKKTRRGTRGGRGRKKKTAAAAAAGGNGAGAPEDVPTVAPAKIHVPDPDLGEAPVEEAEPTSADAETEENGADAPKPKKKTRRGTRGGRGRKRKTAAAVQASAEDAAEDDKKADWEYVPMSEWGDEELSS
jgi:predicted RNA-binding protein with TRAM domain